MKLRNNSLFLGNIYFRVLEEWDVHLSLIFPHIHVFIQKLLNFWFKLKKVVLVWETWKILHAKHSN